MYSYWLIFSFAITSYWDVAGVNGAVRFVALICAVFVSVAIGVTCGVTCVADVVRGVVTLKGAFSSVLGLRVFIFRWKLFAS